MTQSDRNLISVVSGGSDSLSCSSTKDPTMRSDSKSIDDSLCNNPTTRVRPRALVFGISSNFEPKKHFTDPVLPGSSTMTSTFKSKMRFGTGKTESVVPEENTMELLKELNFNLGAMIGAVNTLRDRIEHGIAVQTQQGNLNNQSKTLYQKNEKVLVSVRVRFLDISEIDLSRGLFVADIVLQSKWHESSLDELSEDETDCVDWDSLWVPEIILENEVASFRSDDENRSIRAITTGKNGLNMVLIRQKIRSQFHFKPSLFLYPFDCQSLSIKISTLREVDEVEIEEDEYECCSIGASLSQSGSYSIQPLVSTDSQIQLDTLTDSSRAQFTCTAFACRNWVPQFFKSFLPLFLLAFLLVLLSGHQSSKNPKSYSASSQNSEEPSDFSVIAAIRTGVLIVSTCLFIIIAFCLTSTIEQPSSNTLQTSYVVFHSLFVVIMTSKNVCVNLGLVPESWNVPFSQTDFLEMDQLVAILIFLSLNFLFYTVISIIVFIRFIRMRRKMKRLLKRESDYKRLRSAREQSVQSFSHLSKPTKQPNTKPNSSKKPRNYEGARQINQHQGALPRSKWRRENENIPNVAYLVDDSSPDNPTKLPRSISLPTSSIHGLKEIPV